MEKHSRAKYEPDQLHEGTTMENEAFHAAYGRRRRLKAFLPAWRWYRIVHGLRVGGLVMMGGSRSPFSVERIGLRVGYSEAACSWTAWLRRKDGRSVKVDGEVAIAALVPCIKGAPVAQGKPQVAEKRGMGVGVRPKAKRAGGVARAGA
jgi:hypothetical protein